jgi:hypothetical protein
MPVHIRPFLTLPLASCLGVCFLITLLVLRSGPAYAEWWVRALNNQTDPTLYVDSDTIRRNGTVVKWWELLDYKTVQTVAGISFLSMKVLREYDCAGARIRVLAMADFSGNMANGQVVFTDFAQSNWEPVQPESMGQALWKAACVKE